jgi:hypothetical protein
MLLFAELLLLIDRWPTTLIDAIRAERECFRERFSGVAEADVRRVVDDRYWEFIAPTP